MLKITDDVSFEFEGRPVHGKITDIRTEGTESVVVIDLDDQLPQLMIRFNSGQEHSVRVPELEAFLTNHFMSRARSATAGGNHSE